MKKLFLNSWFWVAVMFLVLTFTRLFDLPIRYFEHYLLQVTPTSNYRVITAVSLIASLVLPLVLAYYVSKLIIGRKRRAY